MTVSGGTGDTFAGNICALTASATNLTMGGTGNSVSAQSSTLTLLSGESMVLTGGYNIINAVAGDGNTVNAANLTTGGTTTDGQATGITLGIGVSATVVGAGNTITALGGSSVTASNCSILANAGTSFTASGANLAYPVNAYNHYGLTEKSLAPENAAPHVVRVCVNRIGKHQSGCGRRQRRQ